MNNENLPVKNIRVGQGIKATVWENKNSNGTWHNVSISRTFKDADGQLRDTNSFTKEQLPLVEKAADLAFRFLQERENLPQSHGGA